MMGPGKRMMAGTRVSGLWVDEWAVGHPQDLRTSTAVTSQPICFVNGFDGTNNENVTDQ